MGNRMLDTKCLYPVLDLRDNAQRRHYIIPPIILANRTGHISLVCHILCFSPYQEDKESRLVSWRNRQLYCFLRAVLNIFG